MVTSTREREGTVSTSVGPDEVPETIRSLHAFDRIDYIDAFTLTTRRAGEKSAEEWGRAVLEESEVGRRYARPLWHSLGLRLEPPGAPGAVQGWTIADRGEDWIRIETASWFATAHAVCRVDDGQVTVSLSLRFEHPLGSAIWAPVGVGHRRGVPVMLRQALEAHGRQRGTEGER